MKLHLDIPNEVRNLSTCKGERFLVALGMTNNILLVERGSGSSSGSVVTLNGQNGTVIWETEQNVVSNVAVDGSAAFFLTTSAELIAYDLETGQKVGFAQFSGGDVFQGESRGCFVAASTGMVFVYFGDSRQLFSFHSPPEVQMQEALFFHALRAASWYNPADF